MKDVSHRESFAFSARVLGALFYFAPDSEQAAPLVQALTAGEWVQDWPLPPGTLQPVADTFAASADEPLRDAWQRLFIGPYALPAPPWGSVWLDRESVLFGDSTLALRQWMRENAIAFEMQQNEPEGLCYCWRHGWPRTAAMRSVLNFWRGTCCRGAPASCPCLSTTPGIRFIPRWVSLRS